MRDVVDFIDEEIMEPVGHKLVPYQVALLQHCFTFNNGRLPYRELLWVLPMKAGKTTLAAGVMLWVAFCWEGRYRRIIVAANSLDQAQERAFQDCVDMIERNKRLARRAKVYADHIVIDGDTVIQAVPCNPRRLAGGRPTAVSQDEIWAVEDDERLTQVYEELRPDPSQENAFRLIVSHAGYPGTLLSRLVDRGMAGEPVQITDTPLDGLTCKADGRFFMAYDTALRVPWQSPEWVEDQRKSLREDTFQRQVKNRFAEREDKALDPADIDAAFTPGLYPILYDPRLPEGTIYVAGMDVAVRHDSTAIDVLALLSDGKQQLVQHRIWTPRDGGEVWLPDVANYLEEVHREMPLHALLYDPTEAAGIVQFLDDGGIRGVRIDQTLPNQTQMVNALVGAFRHRLIMLYAEAEGDLGEHLRNVEIEKVSGGSRLKKPSHDKLIDGAVALSLALMGCMMAAEHAEEWAPSGQFAFAAASVDGTDVPSDALVRAPWGQAAAVGNAAGQPYRPPHHPPNSEYDKRHADVYDEFEDYPAASDWRPRRVPRSPGCFDGSDRAACNAAYAALHEQRRREARLDQLRARDMYADKNNPEAAWLHDRTWDEGGLA